MQTPREVVQAWVDAFNRADADAVASLYTKDATNHQVVRDPVEGRPAIHGKFLGTLPLEPDTLTCVQRQSEFLLALTH